MQLKRKRSKKFQNYCFRIFSISILLPLVFNLSNCTNNKSYNNRSSDENQSTLCESICTSLNFVNEFTKGKTVDGVELQKHANILEQLTEIKSDLDDSPLGGKNPSSQNLNDWRNWIEKSNFDCPCLKEN